MLSHPFFYFFLSIFDPKIYLIKSYEVNPVTFIIIFSDHPV